MIPVVAARKLYDVQYEYVRNYLYAKMPTTDDVDTWSIDPSKKILVYLSACSKSLGVMFRWKYRESYYVLTLETQSRSDRASKIRIASVQSLNYLYCGRANPTSIGSGCNVCHDIRSGDEGEDWKCQYEGLGCDFKVKGLVSRYHMIETKRT